MASAPPRRFRFGRSEVEARPGDTILAALARRGWPSLARSIRYHRPRGPVCGVGNCTGCLVRVNGVPNVRSCRRPARDGDVVRSENSWPSPRFDLFGALDLLLPNGVDTLHGLRRPAWAAPLYQGFGRRLAGFGRVPDRSPDVPARGSRSRTTEVTVVGGGRSGRAVTEALVRSGEHPLLLERRSTTDPDGPGPALTPGAELLPGTTATFLDPPRPGEGSGFTLLAIDDDAQGVLVRTRTVILATGAYDGSLVFEGSDRPGVITADLALSGAGLPLGESVVVGGGARARAVLDRLGPGVTAVVAFGEIVPEVVRAAADLQIPLYPRSRVVRSVGHAHVRALELARRDGGGTFRLPCRTVVLAHRRLPNAQLAFQGGARRRWIDVPGAYYPEVDGLGRTSVPGIWAVGSAATPSGRAGPAAEQVVAAVLDPGTPAPPPAPGPPSELVPYYRELLDEPRHGKWVVCPCEDVLLGELEAAVARGYRGIELVMRYTGVGTGLCQGRYCLPEAIVLLSILEGRAPAEGGFVTQRPPLVPTSLGALAALREELLPEAGT
jgi:sarcosine oxidase subunit alpha